MSSSNISKTLKDLSLEELRGLVELLQVSHPEAVESALSQLMEGQQEGQQQIEENKSEENAAAPKPIKRDETLDPVDSVDEAITITTAATSTQNIAADETHETKIIMGPTNHENDKDDENTVTIAQHETDETPAQQPQETETGDNANPKDTPNKNETTTTNTKETTPATAPTAQENSTPASPPLTKKKGKKRPPKKRYGAQPGKSNMDKPIAAPLVVDMGMADDDNEKDKNSEAKDINDENSNELKSNDQSASVEPPTSTDVTPEPTSHEEMEQQLTTPNSCPDQMEITDPTDSIDEIVANETNISEPETKYNNNAEKQAPTDDDDDADTTTTAISKNLPATHPSDITTTPTELKSNAPAPPDTTTADETLTDPPIVIAVDSISAPDPPSFDEPTPEKAKARKEMSATNVNPDVKPDPPSDPPALSKPKPSLVEQAPSTTPSAADVEEPITLPSKDTQAADDTENNDNNHPSTTAQADSTQTKKKKKKKGKKRPPGEKLNKKDDATTNASYATANVAPPPPPSPRKSSITASHHVIPFQLERSEREGSDSDDDDMLLYFDGNTAGDTRAYENLSTKEHPHLGCYLVYDPAAGGKLVLHYSKSPVQQAIGFFQPSPDHTIPGFKFTRNHGRVELIGHCASGLTGRKNYYSGWCQYIRAAKDANGTLYIYQPSVEDGKQGLDIDLYVLYAKSPAVKCSVQLPENRPICVSEIEGVACLPKDAEFLSSNIRVDASKWMGDGNALGTTMQLQDGKKPIPTERTEGLFIPGQSVESTESSKDLQETPSTEEAQTESGCYLVYEERGCKLIEHYSKTYVPGAIGFYAPGEGHRIPPFKFKSNQGRNELIGNCASGVAGRKNYYNGWCQFIRAAKGMEGNLRIFPRAEGQSGLDVDLYVYTRDTVFQQTTKLPINTILDNVSKINAVACLPKHAEFFEGLTMDMTRWVEEGSKIGAAMQV